MSYICVSAVGIKSGVIAVTLHGHVAQESLKRLVEWGRVKKCSEMLAEKVNPEFLRMYSKGDSG